MILAAGRGVTSITNTQTHMRRLLFAAAPVLAVAAIASSNLPEGPEIDVTIFPLVRLREGDTPDLTALQPLSFDPDAPSRPGGLTRCQNGATSHTTYPFFIEPWRPDSDITGRYAAALADRMALHLMTQLTEDEARP